jgi:hypothetical protein
MPQVGGQFIIGEYTADSILSLVATRYFIRYTLRHFFGTPQPPEQLANGRSIDTSVQFLLFWYVIPRGNRDTCLKITFHKAPAHHSGLMGNGQAPSPLVRHV